MDDTSSGRIKLKDDTTMHIPDPMFQGPLTKLEREAEINRKKEEQSKKKAIQSFAKAHLKRRKKK